jgi:pimeloyl-ACP methyl ester carboxylesterase
MSSVWVDLLGTEVKTSGGRYQGRYLEAGAGEPLLLLHGLGGHVETFHRNIPVYAKYFHVFALDAPWHGYGPQPPFNPELFPTYIDHLLDFLDWQGIDSAHVEGQSMGGWTTLRLAHDHPDRVRKIVLTTAQGFKVTVPGVEFPPTPAGMRRGHYPYLDDPSFENIKARVMNLVADPANMTDEMISIRQKIYQQPGPNASMRDVGMNYLGPPDSASRRHMLSESDLKEIQAPALVYWGEKNVVPAAFGERVAQLIPNAQFYSRPNTGHWAQFEGADDHNREVLRFLTGNPTLQPPPYDQV